jgi:hypothetical protein
MEPPTETAFRVDVVVRSVFVVFWARRRSYYVAQSGENSTEYVNLIGVLRYSKVHAALNYP